MPKHLLPLALVIVGLAAASPAAAQSSFNPLAPCSQVLSDENDLPKAAIGFWAFGFLDAATGEAHEVNQDRIGAMLRALGERCAASPDARLYDIAQNLAESQSSNEPPEAEAGRTLLMRFFDPAEDHEALTLSLKPSPQDVRAVYSEPLATALIEAYEGMFVPGSVIQPKPEHAQLLSTFTTTGQLKAEAPVLDDFPGGYKEVLQYIIGDVPIARFKFVEQGETLGLAFDGLIYVNGHWVFMPKPWRVIPE